MAVTPKPETTTVIDPKNLLTPKMLAGRLHVGVGWVYEKSRARDKGNPRPLPVLRCGRYLRFDWKQVSEWLQSNQNSQ